MRFIVTDINGNNHYIEAGHYTIEKNILILQELNVPRLEDVKAIFNLDHIIGFEIINLIE